MSFFRIINLLLTLFWYRLIPTLIARFMGPTWGPPGSCRSQMGPMLAPWALLSGWVLIDINICKGPSVGDVTSTENYPPHHLLRPLLEWLLTRRVWLSWIIHTSLVLVWLFCKFVGYIHHNFQGCLPGRGVIGCTNERDVIRKYGDDVVLITYTKTLISFRDDDNKYGTASVTCYKTFINFLNPLGLSH